MYKYFMFISIVTLSIPVYAETPRAYSIDLAGMGGVGTVVGNDLELITNPALMDYRGTRFSIPGLTLSISDPRVISNMIQDDISFLSNLSDTNAQAIRDFTSKQSKKYLLVNVSLFPSFQLSTFIGTFGIAGFGISENSAKLNLGNLGVLADLYDLKDNFAGNITTGGTSTVTVDKPVDLISISDVGAVVGYAKKFNIIDIIDVAFGVDFRGFERFRFDFAPSAQFSLTGGNISEQDAVNNIQNGQAPNISAPSADSKFDLGSNFSHGRGYAVDGGLLVGREFATLGVYLRNIWSNTIQYSNGDSSKDALQYNIGISSRPLWFADVVDGITVAAEMDSIRNQHTFHSGLQWKFGNNQLNIAPRAGYEYGYIDPRGTYYHLNRFDVGVVSNLVAIKLMALFSYDNVFGYQFGAGLSFGYEWDK